MSFIDVCLWGFCVFLLMIPVINWYQDYAVRRFMKKYKKKGDE